MIHTNMYVVMHASSGCMQSCQFLIQGCGSRCGYYSRGGSYSYLHVYCVVTIQGVVSIQGNAVLECELNVRYTYKILNMNVLLTVLPEIFARVLFSLSRLV